jgi:glutamate 5-kinase
MPRPELVSGTRLVVKIGTTSLTTQGGEPEEDRVARLIEELAALRERGIEVVLVSSGAIAAGLGPLGIKKRPSDIPSLQAAAAVGQGRLLRLYNRMLEQHGLQGAQILLTRYDFMHRQQYLNARNTIERLLSLGVVPIVNENDTVAVDEIRFGDNDRLAALVANLVRADLLVLLTDAQGVHAGDPRKDPNAPVLEEIDRITPEIERLAGGRGSEFSSGGMSSKLAAAWVATFSGVGVIIGDAREPDVIARLTSGVPLGTYFHPHPHRASARRLWIAFGQPPKGTVVVDPGARDAIVGAKRSLLAVGVIDVRGAFEAGDVVDVARADGEPFARGLVRYSAQELAAAQGRPTAELAQGEVIHRDQLVVLESDA